MVKKLTRTEQLSKSGYVTLVLAGLFLFFVLTGYSFSVVLNNFISILNNYLLQIAQDNNIQSISIPFINIDISSLILMYILLIVIGLLILYLYINYRLAKEIK